MSTMFCPNCGKKIKSITDICLACETYIHEGDIIKTDYDVHDIVFYKNKKHEITDIFLDDDFDVIIELDYGFDYVSEDEIV